MGIFYYIDTAQQLMVLVAEGDLADEQFVEDIETALNDPVVGPDLRVLFDLRGVEQFKVTTWSVHAITGITKSMESKLTNVKMAIVASNALIYGMARMYKILRSSSPAEVVVFRDLDEAKCWLGATEVKELA